MVSYDHELAMQMTMSLVGLVSIDLSGTLGVGGGEDAGGTMGKSLLLVAGNARSSSNLAQEVIVLLISQTKWIKKVGIRLCSTMGFMNLRSYRHEDNWHSGRMATDSR